MTITEQVAAEVTAAPLGHKARAASDRVAAGIAIAIFAAFCAVVLSKASQLLEPDDYAYRASIAALSQGHLTLTNTQYLALAKELAASSTQVAPVGPNSGQGIMQWVQLSNGNWISEKNPGYPFLALPFKLLGNLRLAPLFYGGLACLSLFFGARRWLGRWGGVWAVGLFCSSGAALVFAWRATMPTFTDASLIAAGAGALIWSMLATERSSRRRIIVGLLGFVALEAAVFVRYTNIVLLLAAIVAVLLFRRAAEVKWAGLFWWFGSVGLFGCGVLLFDQLTYGNAFKTGYASGEITFNLSSILPNIGNMPIHLIKSMPMLVLALIGLGWMAIRLRGTRGGDAESHTAARRDAAVGSMLALGWFGIWGLYSAYSWTVGQAAGGGGNSVHVIRFYLPAIGLIALLGAWLLTQLPGWLPAVGLAAILGIGATSAVNLAKDAQSGPLGGPGGHSGPGQPGPPPNGGVPNGPPQS